MNNNCVSCGAVIPEGRQYCPNCGEGVEKARKYYDIHDVAKVTKARYHHAINIEKGIKSPLGLRGCITTDGKVLKTAAEAREFLRGQLALGRKYLPCGDCDNFDYASGCKGHPEKGEEMEEKKIKRIGAYKVLSDETLKGETKADLIERIRILEHNWAATEESFNNSVKNSDKIFAEQNAEIERLTEENGYLKQCADTFLDDCKRERNQAVKDTAKEILQYVGDLYDDGDQRFQLKNYQWHKNLCNRYGVEVE